MIILYRKILTFSVSTKFVRITKYKMRRKKKNKIDYLIQNRVKNENVHYLNNNFQPHMKSCFFNKIFCNILVFL